MLAGTISVPATNSIVSRNTNDYSFNIGVNPTVHIGNNVVTFNSGVQETVRRDSESPVEMNQNLFRLFTYMSTSSFFDAVSMDGYVLRETGPFTESNEHSTAFCRSGQLSRRSALGEDRAHYRVGRERPELQSRSASRITTPPPTSASIAGSASHVDLKGSSRRPPRLAHRRSRVQASRRICDPPAFLSIIRRRDGACRPAAPGPAIAASISTTQFRAASPSLMECPSTGNSKTKPEMLSCSIPSVFQPECNRRPSSISQVGKASS